MSHSYTGGDRSRREKKEKRDGMRRAKSEGRLILYTERNEEGYVAYGLSEDEREDDLRHDDMRLRERKAWENSEKFVCGRRRKKSC